MNTPLIPIERNLIAHQVYSVKHSTNHTEWIVRFVYKNGVVREFDGRAWKVIEEKKQ